MGEPVTEEMLRQWEDGCVEPAPTLVEEVRRLRDALTQASRTHAEGWTSGYDHGTGEGYARAERDVVAHAERCRAVYAAARRNGLAVPDADVGIDTVRMDIEQGAHRGAAKEGT